MKRILYTALIPYPIGWGGGDPLPERLALGAVVRDGMASMFENEDAFRVVCTYDLARQKPPVMTTYRLRSQMGE